MGKEDFIKRIVDSEEFKLLDKVVNEPEQVSTENAVQVVSDKTMAALASLGIKRPNDGYGLPDYNISLALMELTQRLEPARHHKLVEFVSKLQKQTARDPSTGEPLVIDKTTLWTDLPSFGYVELETWCEFGGSYKDPCDAAMPPAERQRWVNLNSFIAQVTQAADVQYGPADKPAVFHPMDKSLRALWVMQKALENEQHAPAALADTPAMHAACAWFAWAADRLWENVQRGRTYAQAPSAGAGSPRFKERGWNGFERDRWDVWLQGLREARETAADEASRGIIDHALVHMTRTMGESS